MKKAFMIVMVIVGASVGWFISTNLQNNPNTDQSSQELSERAQEFIAERKAEEDQTWRLARLEEAEVETEYIENNPCFRATIAGPVQLPKTLLGTDSCSFQTTTTEPHAKLMISYQPSTSPLSEDTGVIFRQRNEDYMQLEPIDPNLIPPEVLEQIRFESDTEHLTMLRTPTSQLTLSFSQITRKPDNMTEIADDILSTIQFNR